MYRGRKCTAPIELPHVGPGDVLKGALPGLDKGVNAFFCGVSYCQSVKIHECLLRMCGFQCIGGRNVLPPPSCRMLGWAMHQKVRQLAFVEALMHFSMAYPIAKV